MSAREKRHDYDGKDPQQVPTCFAMLPCEVLYDRKLSPAARLYYACLAQRADFRTGRVLVPQRQLAADLGCSQRWAYNCQAELEDAGHLRVERSNGRRSTYVLPWLAVHNRDRDNDQTAEPECRGTAEPEFRGLAKTAEPECRANSESLSDGYSDSAGSYSAVTQEALWTTPTARRAGGRR